MTLIVEDGTGLADAQTYVDADAARAYALTRGVALDNDDSIVEAMLVKSMDYLEAQRARYQGTKTFPTVQALQWPRTDVVIDCTYDLDVDAIPVELKKAQMQLCLEIHSGFTLLPSSDGRVVKRTKVDVLEKEFFSTLDLGMSGGPAPQFPAVDALLAPLFQACGGAVLRTVRV